MNFTYSGYEHLLNILMQNGYDIVSYDECDAYDKCAVLRHDVDNDLTKTLRIAEIERALGAKSTFFLLLSSDLYNVFSAEGKRIIDELYSMGHEVALHFDEQKYPDDIGDPEKIKYDILNEAKVLSIATGQPIVKVSMHRPSKEIIDCDLQIPDMINTYGKKYITDFKYVSDSRRRWREPVEEYINENKYNKLQILVHPFWYNDKELSLKDSLSSFINGAVHRCYDVLDDNFTDLKDIIRKEDV